MIPSAFACFFVFQLTGGNPLHTLLTSLDLRDVGIWLFAVLCFPSECLVIVSIKTDSLLAALLLANVLILAQVFLPSQDFEDYFFFDFFFILLLVHLVFLFLDNDLSLPYLHHLLVFIVIVQLRGAPLVAENAGEFALVGSIALVNLVLIEL